MVGRVLKYLVIAGLLWASWHVGMAQWQQFVFQDDLKQIAQFGGNRDDEQIRAAVMEAATARQVPMSPDRLVVRRVADHLFIDGAYTVRIELLPRYRYSWDFTVSAEGWFVPGGQLKLPR